MANAAETLRVGLSAHAQSTGNIIVEHNLFARCRGENELISNKASGNTYRYNTFIESPGAQVTLRHGNDCVVYGNIFRDTEGLRIFGDRHLVFSNYFEKNYMGINLGNGSGEGPEAVGSSGHDRPDDCVIIFNTLVNNRTHYQLSRRAQNALGATNTTFAFNVLQGGEVGAKLEGPYTGAVWRGNLLWKTASAGDLPPNAFKEIDPLLVLTPEGPAHLTAGSPAIDATTDAFPAVLVDIDGQPRSGALDAGADELSDAPVTVQMLTPEQVGPMAKG
jgi:poly(beta-D-mannuronate) lyase